jgi:NAD(P)-dependent dehydrogenase (short-subunit alcohol dehydrogenase family)
VPARRLAGKVALVTGSSRGAGRAIARALAAEGAWVGVHSTSALEVAYQVVSEIAEAAGRARVYQGDLARPEECRRLLQMAARDLGAVDILVNNAGLSRERSLRKMTSAEWDEAIGANLSSVFHCTKAALEPMIARGWGRIVNIAAAGEGQAGDAAAQAGVIAFTKSVALELSRYQITVNAVCPNPAGSADEVARLVRFLCTDGDWLTGAQLNIDGGQVR